MAEQRGAWPGAGTPPPGWREPPGIHAPSGLFPSGPPRPRYREPHPVRLGALLAGIGAGAAWLLLPSLLARDLRGYAWITFLAGCAAWLASWLLTRIGDRGAAAGVAMSTAVGWAVATGLVAVRWAVTGDWPLW